MNKILLAGGQGFIGSHLNYQLKKQASVISLDYGSNSTEKDFINLDLTDINQVNNFTVNSAYFEVLIFLVGLAHKKGKGKELDEFRRINKQTLVNLLSALEVQGKLPNKIIFASTISVYGENINQNIYNEDSEKNPFSPYAVTKLETEEYLLKNYGVQSWVLRFAPVYSPDFQLNINRRTKAAGRYYKVRKGSKKLSLCNLENIGSVVQDILKEKVPAGVYNISDENEYTYDELLRWKKSSWVLPVPAFSVRLLYYLGKFFNSTFFKENTIKLISDNVYPSDKIRSYVELPSVINDVIFDND